MISSKDALQRLRDGNRRFVSGEISERTQASREHHAGPAQPQEPFAIVLACSDSRVPAELVFDCGIGEIFVIRVAGNVVAPMQTGSIEYAATQLGTPLVVVLGHSNCGAVAAALHEIVSEESQRSPNLRAILDRIRPAIEDVLASHDDVGNDAVVGECIRANVLASVTQLLHESVILAQLVENDELKIVAAEYSIETGAVEFFETA